MHRINRSALCALLVLTVALAFVAAGWAGEKADEAAQTDIHHFASIDDLKKAVKEHDYLFIILAADEKGDGAIHKAALALTKKAEADDVVACVAELSRECDGFKKYAKKAGARKLPAVLMFRKDGTSAVVEGDITAKRLAKAYTELAGAKSEGCPFASKHSNCDPTACGFKK